MQRTSRHSRKPDGISAGTYGNLDFETVPDASWAIGDAILNGGMGFLHAFENFSQYPLGAMPAGGAKTVLFSGAADSIATYRGINKPVEIVADGIGTDNILITSGDSGAAVTAPLVARFECLIAITDIAQQAFFSAINAAATRFAIAGIFNSTWVVTNAAGVPVVCNDLAAPVAGAWHHLELIYEFATDTTRIIVDNVQSAITGKCIGGAAADLSNMAEISGWAAIGLATPAVVYTIWFAAVDFNGVPDYVENRSVIDLPRCSGDVSGAYNFSFGETANNLDLILHQNATVTRPTHPRFSMKVWVSEAAYQNARAVAPDVIVNGTFDVNIAGWNAGNIPQHPQFAGNIAQDPLNFHAGGASLVIHPVTGHGGASTDLIVIQPGQNYILSYWAAQFAGAGKQTIAAAVSFYDNDNVQLGATRILGNHGLNPGWTNYFDHFNTHTGAVSFRLHFMVTGDVIANICVDDVTCLSCGLPRVQVQDVASGTWYASGADYQGEGWYTLSVRPVRTGNNFQWIITTRCGHGWICFDNGRID